ncbi:10096_t:CDS:2 [Ambispora gerdemannii]|uniref:10096_t:CDS:1 n=1 Tax=Ambispora gerdemannii TaxID=144530 RepID=A0A9N9FJK9_9GLOM|nr:10096_t:CDS:2 [Ambispora gerdemannii]
MTTFKQLLLVASILAILLISSDASPGYGYGYYGYYPPYNYADQSGGCSINQNANFGTNNAKCCFVNGNWVWVSGDLLLYM